MRFLPIFNGVFMSFKNFDVLRELFILRIREPNELQKQDYQSAFLQRWAFKQNG